MKTRLERLHRASLLATLTCAALPACAPVDGDGTEQQTDELIGAPTDARHRFDVGVCSGPLTGGASADAGACTQVGTRCSGTLVAPNLVLTARHCVRQIAYGPTAGFCDGVFTSAPPTTAPVRVTTSDSVLEPDAVWYGVRRVLEPAGTNSCADDLALLVLDRPVPLRVALPVPMMLGRDLARAPVREVAVVGRGVVSEVLDLETFEVTTDEGGLRRRILQHIPFVCATNDAATGCTVADYSSPPTNRFTAPPGYFVIGAGTAAGDSGAGVLAQSGLALVPRVLGVESAGTYGPDGRPNYGLVVRLDHHRAFILDGLVRAALDLGRERNAFIDQAE